MVDLLSCVVLVEEVDARSGPPKPNLNIVAKEGQSGFKYVRALMKSSPALGSQGESNSRGRDLENKNIAPLLARLSYDAKPTFLYAGDLIYLTIKMR